MVLGCFLVAKLSLMIEVQGFNLITSVPQHSLTLCIVGDIFIFLNMWNSTQFGLGFYNPQAATFFQSFYIVFPLSSMLLVAFYWLEITYFVERKVAARLTRLQCPAGILIASIFIIEIVLDILRASRAASNLFIGIIVIYAILALVSLTILILAIVRVLTRVGRSQSVLAQDSLRLALQMIGIFGAGLVMIAGLIVYGVSYPND